MQVELHDRMFSGGVTVKVVPDWAQEDGSTTEAATTSAATMMVLTAASDTDDTSGVAMTTTIAPATTTSTNTTAPATTTTTVLECSFADSIPQAMRSVFQVVTDQGTGTAFHIGRGIFATAAHVVVDADQTDLLIDGEPTPTSLGAWNTVLDLAFLLIEDENPPIPTLDWADTSLLQPGTEVAVVGFPTGVTGSASATDGLLSRVATYPGDVTFLQTNAEANPGNSGGPVITECGTVAGVVLSKLVAVEIEGISYALDASRTLLFYDWWAGTLPDPPAFYNWGPDVTACMTADEEAWLQQVTTHLDRLEEVNGHFLDLWEQAADETGTLVENDPTWEQAFIITAFRFEEPALAILDLLPSSGGLTANDHLLAETARMFADLAQDLPAAIVTGNMASRDQILLEDLDWTAWNEWVDSIYEHCQPAA